MGSGFSTADKKIIFFTLTKQHFTFTMKIALCFLAIVSMILAVPTPQRVGGRVGPSNNSKNGNNSPNTRFFTGNQAIDSAAFGAAAGVAGNYLFNAVTNPCRNGNRKITRGPTTGSSVATPATSCSGPWVALPEPSCSITPRATPATTSSLADNCLVHLNVYYQE